MPKKYLIAIVLSLLWGSVAYAQSSNGTIGVLEQFTSTSSPVSAITQRLFGKSLRLSGYDCTLFSGGGKLTTTATGLVVCDNDGGGGAGGTPGGSNTQVQFNDGGNFGGNAGFIYAKALNLATLTNLITTKSTSTNATTTNFGITSILSKLLKTDGNGTVVGATAGTDYEVPLTFSTGLTRSTNTVTVNTSQNIATLSNLTSNGFVKTSGGTGALSVDTSTYLTGNQSISLTGDITGSGATSIATTLATVNGNVGSFGGTNSIPSFTVNGKGLITAAAANTPSIPASEITSGTFGSGNYTFPANLIITGNATATNATTTALAITGLGRPAGAVLAVDPNGNVIATTTSAGGVTSVTGTSNRITSTGGATPVIDISASYVGQSSITTLGTIATGVWNGTAIANANLANSTISGIALGTNLADLTATNSTLTFSGNYNGGTARNIGLNLANANTWTGVQTINDLISTRSTTTQATTTSFASDKICLTADTCRTTWPTGGSGGTPNSKWATSTDTRYIQPNAALGTIVGLSTTTNATTTNAQYIGGQLIVNGSYMKGGNAASLNPCTGLTCFEFWGDDNSINGVQMGAGNRNAGSSAYAGLFLNNNLSDSTVTHYGFIGYNSSAYSDSTFGTAEAIPNLMYLQSTDGPISLIASTSTSPGYINFITGGANTANERMRITKTGLIGIGTTTPPSRLTVATSTAYSAAFPDLLIGPNGLSSGSANGTLIGANTQAGFTGNFLEFQKNGTSELKVDNAGAITSAGSHTVGASSGYIFSGRSQALSSADGLIELENNAGTGFTRLNFGGVTASFPALLRSGTTLTVNLADGTAGGNFAVGTTTPTWTLTAASTTPVLELDDTNAPTDQKHVIIGNYDGLLMIGTSSDSTLTATSSAVTIRPGVASQLLVGTTTNAVNTASVLTTQGTVFMGGLTTSGSAQTAYLCLDANGQLISDSTTCLVSALKFKKDIHDLPNSYGLSAVLGMRPVTYHLKNPTDINNSGEQVGFIADEAVNVVPDLVLYDSNHDIHGFNYEQYTTVLTKAIQELALGNHIAETGKKVVDNWQWFAIGLLALWNIGLTLKLKRA